MITMKQPKMVSTSTQCTLLTASTVDQSLQIGDSYIESSRSESDIKVELVNLEDIKSEPCDAESSSEEIPSEPVMSRTEKSCMCHLLIIVSKNLYVFMTYLQY
jgi:hypothetical protein